ncbi:hypothetical protein DSO57_1017337 [Entomophthora muscae]|uniref:Uncharacterized protein n=2 Tax=Entomophthora muscae TaxID=34485 RepID=A0ACC2TRT1_9FUNG|nr:hypothetical protein DSO57_1017336 [Entomophthora muscae]KAJ9077369.1 hypothetical protein DSO57_1017337 [Entomophthora muscae]
MQFFSVLSIVPCLALQVASSPLGSKGQNNYDASPNGRSHQLQPRSPGMAVKGLSSFAFKSLGRVATGAMKGISKDPNLGLKTVDFVKDAAFKAKSSIDQNKANKQHSNPSFAKEASHYSPKNSDAGKFSGMNFASGADSRYGKFSGIRQ